MAGITPFAAINSLAARLSVIVLWLTFWLFHLTLFVLFLGAAWLAQWSSAASEVWVEALYRHWHAATFVTAAGFLGVSASAAIYWYVRLWRKLYSALVIPFLFRDINRAMRE